MIRLGLRNPRKKERKKEYTAANIMNLHTLSLFPPSPPYILGLQSSFGPRSYGLKSPTFLLPIGENWKNKKLFAYLYIHIRVYISLYICKRVYIFLYVSACVHYAGGCVFFLSFFLSWVSKTQPNHWTKRRASTRLVT